MEKFSLRLSLNFPGKEACVLWKNVSYKQKEFPNICLLAELMYCLFESNLAVIRGFSIFTMLSDRRLKRLHDLINFCIALQINSKNWSKNGRPKIL